MSVLKLKRGLKATDTVKIDLKDEGNPLDYISRTVINDHVCVPSVLLLRNIANYALPLYV